MSDPVVRAVVLSLIAGVVLFLGYYVYFCGWRIGFTAGRKAERFEREGENLQLISAIASDRGIVRAFGEDFWSFRSRVLAAIHQRPSADRRFVGENDAAFQRRTRDL